MLNVINTIASYELKVIGISNEQSIPAANIDGKKRGRQNENKEEAALIHVVLESEKQVLYLQEVNH